MDAVVNIPKRVKRERWPSVQTRFVEACQSTDGHAALVQYLDDYPFIGPVVASYVAKNMGVPAIKADLWMLRLASHLGYPASDDRVRDMGLAFVRSTGEPLNVVDTVLWNWARSQPALAKN